MTDGNAIAEVLAFRHSPSPLCFVFYCETFHCSHLRSLKSISLIGSTRLDFVVVAVDYLFVDAFFASHILRV